ncbi:VOC family protein [Streptomyces sp. NPDC091292]|uniref:VOC family protein n=1 Tax=Streptomyces sp. NPDC091292 TaxID=3365991 RepID=UPI00381A2B93
MAAFAEGVPCWVDAMLPDVEAGKRFYGDVLDWTFDEGAGAEYGYYTQAYSDGANVAALAPKSDGRMPTVWTVYLATPDAVALAEKIRDAGGQLVREPLPVGPFGTIALAADPGGAVFGLWQGGTHTGFEAQRRPGAYCWTELYTRDKAAVDPFYEGVFGYAGTDLPDEDLSEAELSRAGGGDVRVWSPAGATAGLESAIGGRVVMGESFPAAMPPHFLTYFTVADCDATAASVTRLGGRIQQPPRTTPHGRIAVFSDNQGATFAVLQD